MISFNAEWSSAEVPSEFTNCKLIARLSLSIVEYRRSQGRNVEMLNAESSFLDTQITHHHQWGSVHHGLSESDPH